jgi:UDPglucose--hexose-1-phosphate uridylyltransferase
MGVSELRQDPVTGTWTVLAPGRAGRPKDFSRTPDELADSPDCPFCPGNERSTPPTRWQASLAGEHGWTVRVFENRYPVLEAPDDSDGSNDLVAPGPYRAVTGFGVSEVIVETPRHGEGLADYPDEHLTLLADAYASRLAHLREDVRLSAAVLFRNWGRVGGASLAHAHSQIAALPRVPDALVHEVGNFSQAASSSMPCPLCDALAADDEGGRTVWDDGVVAVHSPYAAPIPYFMRISPRRCSLSLADSPDAERASFGAAMGAAARTLRGVFGDSAFNLVVHVAPFTLHRVRGLPFHWHADVIPRTSDQAGFEWGSRTYVNVVDPDVAARDLRHAPDERRGAQPATAAPVGVT